MTSFRIHTLSIPEPLTVTNGSNPLIVRVGGVGSQDSLLRLRVSNPVTLFDSKQTVDNQPIVWDDAQTAGGSTTSTYNTNQSSSTIAVSAGVAGTRVRQSKRRFNYQPGKSQ